MNVTARGFLLEFSVHAAVWKAVCVGAEPASCSYFLWILFQCGLLDLPKSFSSLALRLQKRNSEILYSFFFFFVDKLTKPSCEAQPCG